MGKGDCLAIQPPQQFQAFRALALPAAVKQHLLEAGKIHLQSHLEQGGLFQRRCQICLGHRFVIRLLQQFRQQRFQVFRRLGQKATVQQPGLGIHRQVGFLQCFLAGMEMLVQGGLQLLPQLLELCRLFLSEPFFCQAHGHNILATERDVTQWGGNSSHGSVPFHGIQAIVPWCTSKSTRQRRQNAALFAQPYLGVRPQGIAQKIHQHADSCGLS